MAGKCWVCGIKPTEDELLEVIEATVEDNGDVLMEQRLICENCLHDMATDYGWVVS